MKLSHTKLNTVLNSPMEYYLNYVLGIKPKVEKKAFVIGSGVHWGIEHSTEDLTEYWKDHHNAKQFGTYSDDQCLAESMVHGYLTHKQELFDKILTHRDGTKMELVSEDHELWVEADLPSLTHPNEPHRFVGQIDLLLLTNRGFVLIDYKTSSMLPEWNKYLDQIYRYIFLLRNNFPEVPIVKIGILNLRKSACKIKRGECEFAFRNRVKQMYELNDPELISYHEYDPLDLDEQLVNDYINNLTNMADIADVIDKNKAWYINYDSANYPYKSDYWDIYYHTPDAYALYNIRDKIYVPDDDELVDIRDCLPFDMKAIERVNIMNKYDKFKDEATEYFNKSSNPSKNELYKQLNGKYLCDNSLLDKYFNTYEYDLAHPGMLDALGQKK